MNSKATTTGPLYKFLGNEELVVSVILKLDNFEDWLRLEMVCKAFQSGVQEAWRRQRSVDLRDLVLAIENANFPLNTVLRVMRTSMSSAKIAHLLKLQSKRNYSSPAEVFYRDSILRKEVFLSQPIKLEYSKNSVLTVTPRQLVNGERRHLVQEKINLALKFLLEKNPKLFALDEFGGCYRSANILVPKSVLQNASTFRSLRKLSLSGCMPSELFSLAKTLQYLAQSLEYLNLRNTHFAWPNRESIEALESAFQKMQNLKFLDVAGCDSGNFEYYQGKFRHIKNSQWDPASLVKCLPCPQKLLSLNLGHPRGNFVFFSLGKFTALKQLELCNVKMSRKNIKRIRKGPKTLKSLSLFYDKRDYSEKHSCLPLENKFLRKFQSLQVLNLKYSNLQCDSLLRTVATYCTEVCFLSISICKYTEKGLGYLKDLKKLKILELHDAYYMARTGVSVDKINVVFDSMQSVGQLNKLVLGVSIRSPELDYCDLYFEKLSGLKHLAFYKLQKRFNDSLMDRIFETLPTSISELSFLCWKNFETDPFAWKLIQFRSMQIQSISCSTAHSCSGFLRNVAANCRNLRRLSLEMHAVEKGDLDSDKETILNLANSLQMIIFLCPKLNLLVLNWELLRNIERLLSVPVHLKLSYI